MMPILCYLKSALYNLWHFVLVNNRPLWSVPSAGPKGEIIELQFTFNMFSTVLSLHWIELQIQNSSLHVLASYLCLLELVAFVLGVLLLQRLHGWNNQFQSFVCLLGVIDDKGGVLLQFGPVVHRLTAAGLCRGRQQSEDKYGKYATCSQTLKNTESSTDLASWSVWSCMCWIGSKSSPSPCLHLRPAGCLLEGLWKQMHTGGWERGNTGKEHDAGWIFVSFTYPVQGVHPGAVSADSLQQSQWPLR